MDGIIMAGGMGKRMRPLTLDTPKPLLHVQGRPILEWSLMSLHGIVDHVLVVVNYLKEQIADYMAQQSLFRSYTLIEQLPTPLGTGHAVQCCQADLKSDDFIVVNGDDLYSKTALRKLSQQSFGVLTMLKDDPSLFGAIVQNDDGHFQRIHEKPPKDLYPPPVPINIGSYKFTTEVFDYKLKKSARGEYEITDYVSLSAEDHTIAVVESPFWLPIGSPRALDDAQSVDINQWIPELA
jgi:UDP-N-acetylglucosamine diphosphorylase / glucose-1-phosphate thymidylyltransferase / UDP-N-acetylgalactosamine diphosphorylase / glucosamine-1-phosphate N-acetyltransferase / galactosamine-1-phosphate N-acetyltransferase